MLMPNPASAEKEVVQLWPDGLPEGAVVISPEKIAKLKAGAREGHIAHVDDPTLTLYPAPKETANGTMVIICPGGGYNILAWPKEGLEVAEWFNTIGVSAAVLKYRVPRRNPSPIHLEPLQDAQRAIRYVRHHAQEWDIKPDRIGMLGFSAGGHLTWMAGTSDKAPSYEVKDDIDKESCRVNFICPIYAAYQGDNYTDKGPLGDLIKLTKDSPAVFMAVTADDSGRGTHAAMQFIRLQELKVPAELHIYTRGGHGYGLRPSDHPVSTWHHRLEGWLGSQGWLKK